MSASLDLALVGNGRIAALIDPRGDVVWGCYPRIDGDPAFCALLGGAATPPDARGTWRIELDGQVAAEQTYLRNTAVLVTRLSDGSGGAIEIVDCVPRFTQHGRMFQPMLHIRQVRRVSGTPRIIVRLRPASGYGRTRPEVAAGSNHLRYVAPEQTLRLTTDAPVTAIADELPFLLDNEIALVFGGDETIDEAPAALARRFVDETCGYWRDWVRRLAIPFEWQDAVIRAAITLQMNQYDDTGAIVAAVTTSIPEAPDSGRTWDYRYCWLRDSYFVVDALNRLNATDTMERYLRYVVNIAAGADGSRLQPVYRINGDAALVESNIESLPGYRGMGPVRIGNDAYRQIQHDVYGSAVLAATHVFFDARLTQQGDLTLFERLEVLGARAIAAHDQPDAGIWEYRGRSRVHTFSSVMCWAACDRLARIAIRLGLAERATHWRAAAERIARFIDEHCYDAARGTYVGASGSPDLDASLLRLVDVGFLRADDPRFAGTVAAIERELKRGEFVYRYLESDDFGVPTNAFLVCTFWFVDALATLGRRDEARALFEALLACRNRHGLLAEHLDPVTREQWGNFVQTYSMVGIIECAIRLSLPWDEAF